MPNIESTNTPKLTLFLGTMENTELKKENIHLWIIVQERHKNQGLANEEKARKSLKNYVDRKTTFHLSLIETVCE